jgi:Zn-dependent protease
MDLSTLNTVFVVVVLLLAISLHESAHAWTASRYGDPTAQLLGRVSLNPIRHIDVFGTIILPALLIISHLPVFGWAKPTPVDPNNFKEPVKADIMTSVAGPVSNFILMSLGFFLAAAVMALAPQGKEALNDAVSLAILQQPVQAPATLSAVFPITLFLVNVIYLNLLLGIFNLVPLPPLDGFGFLFGLSPRPLKLALLPLQQWGPFILLAVLFLPPLRRFLDVYLLVGQSLVFYFLGVLTSAV